MSRKRVKLMEEAKEEGAASLDSSSESKVGGVEEVGLDAAGCPYRLGTHSSGSLPASYKDSQEI